MLHYFVFGMKHEFKLTFLFDGGQLVDVLTVPGMLLPVILPPGVLTDEATNWLSLNFLRALQALLAYERLHELGAMTLGTDKSEVWQEILRLALRFLALIAGFASLVL